jgi:3-demethoxyubiquinol 3-hydroxylase
MTSAKHAAMVRVDQAGEYGATRIYAGQLAVMGSHAPLSEEIAGMARQEAGHLARFEDLMARRRVRPTLLQPLWHVAGYALGPASALAGTIAEFRKDECEHREAALAAGAEQAPLYPLFSGAIRLGCRIAIRLSERI